MIYQVYFKEEQRGILEPQFQPYNNAGMLTNYYENTVIAKLINEPCNSDEYFGVLSYGFRDKIEKMKWFMKPFRNISSESYSLNWLLEQIGKNKDVIFLMEHEPHNPIYAANKIHGLLFERYWSDVIDGLGLSWQAKDIWDRVIYCNYFIAKHSVYARYVNELLIPAMALMESMPKLNEDAKYPKGPGYTYHSFICERLFSYWYNFMYKK